MAEFVPLFEVNPQLEREALAKSFAANGRVQIRHFLSHQSAQTIQEILTKQTPWGLAWHARGEGPHHVRNEQLIALTPPDRASIGRKVSQAVEDRAYAFLFGQYPMLYAYLNKWAEGGPHDLIMEHINDEPFLDLVREVTCIPQLLKADAQATVYSPGHFLGIHDDSHVAEGWRVAYVMNFCVENWHPDWGGYLMFYDEEGDVVAGFKPRFNSLNLFLVPQRHNVTYVPPFAPFGRLAITGWFRDR